MSAYYWALLTALIWGCVPLMEKMGLSRVEPMVGIFYRCLGVIIGIVVLLAFYGKAIKNSFSAFHPTMIWLVAGGFLASILGQICFYHALKTGEASRVVPIGATYPLISFILGVLLLGEKVTLTKIGGISFVLAGVFLLK